MKMPKMAYPGASEGERAETGEREPKGAKSSDSRGTKSKGTVNGVGMGKADATGRSNGGKEMGEYNTGRAEKTCYTHKKG
jgi:hypothetical protein